MSTYTAKSLNLVRRYGFTADVVEKYIPRPGARFGVRRDLFRIIDIIAIDGTTTLGIQSTSIGARGAHIKKLYKEELENTLKWIQGPRELWLVCWRKEKRIRGGIAFRYVPKIEIITPDGPSEISADTLKKLLGL